MAARAYQLDYNFDGDELRSVQVASDPLALLLRRAAGDTGNAPLHVLLLHLWVPVFGDSEVSARAVSLLASAAFLLVAHAWLRRIVSRPIALCVVAFLALSPHFVYYGQQARPYSLAALLSVANLLAFQRVAEAPAHRGRLAVWFLLSVLLIYTLFLGTLLVACEIIVALVLWRRDGRAVAAVGTAAVAALLPWMALWMSRVRPGQPPLEGIAWAGLPTLSNYVWFHVHLFGEVPGLQGRWLLALLAVVALAYVKRLVASRRITADELVLLLLGVAVPAFVFAMSLLMQRPFFAGRHMIGSGVAVMALLGLGLDAFRRGAGVLLALALIAWSVAGLPNAFPQNAKPPWRDVAAWIDDRYGSMPVAGGEPWGMRPLIRYRTAGPVLRLPGLGRWRGVTRSQTVGSDALLFVCRPDICAQAKALEARRTLVKTWRWGYGDVAEQGELRLYEISSLAAGK
jgi:hypothetical protein